ncbi:MAG TPA: hypothetical protein VEG37_00555 [Burkholderiales bacterium]|nr:hypothetical protein [Burkholderiales bacterium]
MTPQAVFVPEKMLYTVESGWQVLLMRSKSWLRVSLSPHCHCDTSFIRLASFEHCIAAEVVEFDEVIFTSISIP